MGKYVELAKQAIEAVGGKENVSNVAHCMTRLRFYTKDVSLVNVEELKKIKGINGVQVLGNEIQAIIGSHVAVVYADVIDVGGFKEMDEINENLDGEVKAKGIKGVLDTLLALFAGCITPTIPAFCAMGIIKLVQTLVGPTALNLCAEDSGTYIILGIAFDAITYFLPFFVAYTASRKFRTNTIITMAMAGILLHPDFTALVSSNTSISFLKIPVTLVDYSGSIIPMMLITYAQSWVEKFLNRVIPEVVNSALVPALTVLILLPVGLCVLGPIGQFIGYGLLAGLNWLYSVAGPIETTLVGAMFIFTTAFGIGYPVFIITLMTFLQTGEEYMFLPMNYMFHYSILGISLAYLLKSKSGEKKALATTAFTSQFFGGVSEPGMYGIIFPNKAILAVNCIACGLAGLYLGITKTCINNMGVGTNMTEFMAFMGGSTTNTINGCIACAIALVAAFAGTFIFYKEKEEK